MSKVYDANLWRNIIIERGDFEDRRYKVSYFADVYCKVFEEHYFSSFLEVLRHLKETRHNRRFWVSFRPNEAEKLEERVKLSIEDKKNDISDIKG